jgi:hypothetical protein
MLAILQGIRVLAMETKKGLLGFFAAIVLLSVNPAFAQAPPNNDDFAHRNPLTGSSITFTGTLVGATFEPAETNSSFPGMFYSSGRSVWWTWTASESTAVVIAIRPESWPSLTNGTLDVLSGTSLDALSRANTFPTLFSKPPSGYVRFDATAGTSYQIRVAAWGTSGGVGGPFTLQLTATNPPLFIVQPQSYTVSPYGSAFFSSIATGPEPRITGYPRGKTTTSYQWLFNGVPLPGETFPCLLVHGITTNQAGSYSVIASNVGGITQSGSATLTVVDTNPVPRLAVLPPNNSNLRFTLTGEPGRWYRVESSTNLQDWINPTFLQLTNPTTLVSVPRLAPNHFVRAALDIHTDVCVAQLKQMWWATHMFAMDNRKGSSDTYGLNDLQAYVPATSIFGTMPFCPDLGVYAAGGALRDPPTCSLYYQYGRGHVITDP